jgi:cytochrome c-type biogenesis protein
MNIDTTITDGSLLLAVPLALAAGLVSFLSPCVLPLVPGFLSYVTGMTGVDLGDRHRGRLFTGALLFVAGFSLVFILLGASATALGRALNYYQVWLQRLGGVIVIGFGLVSLGVFGPGLLTRERRVHLEQKPVGYLGSALVGMAFAAGWTPCIGPVLGGILGLAATTSDLSRGMLLLGFYSAGLAVPFLLAAVALESFLEWFQRFRRFLPWVMRVSGALLVLVGILLVSGEFTRLAGWLQTLTPERLRRSL